ncbi:UDP-glucose dehydrogenase family protein [Corynebacterium kutscheri]|uniref:UDP-glucose 6-dehydrogenase n=1 Tax=Corynebacterium kutscheri TaxID=35755 RepID=A0A0F6R1T9_9CORY|nr:UDP-glucose/GDP-mannose dehydrogenase family protein [Corynebacterium kutscheri]AKE42065.1 nucleotide sugar dehydrogenase [Corynebacterium kutscheri]VEH10406.1 UDP-glucose 6-dehydrogenase [Corynebacterium kutscheri]
MNISVIGTGYLGATHAACLARLGHNVLGIDIDAQKISALENGEVPFYEPGLQAIVEQEIHAGHLRFSTSFSAAATHAHLHFLTVGTPQCADSYAADTSFLEHAIDNLVPYLIGEHIIVGKSTVPVGTAQRLQQRVDQLAGDHARVEVVWNPEFLREGFAVKDTLHPDRIVVGCAGTHIPVAEVGHRLREVYAAALLAGTSFISCDLATAELIKLAANAFLATKISFINSLSDVCTLTGADVVTLSAALGLDKRIGHNYFNAGLGFGGGCLPKDIRAFMASAHELGALHTYNFLAQVEQINQHQRESVVELVSKNCFSLPEATIAVLGCAFKPHSDDVRDSPALAVATELVRRGAKVKIYDPQAMTNAQRHLHEQSNMHYAQSACSALTGADVVLLATEWPEFVHLDPTRAKQWVRTPVIVDARNVLDPACWREAGWQYHGIGR